MRIVVMASNDDQVFDPSGDEEVTVLHESEIAGAEERPRPGVCQSVAECLCRLRGLSVIAGGHAAAADPDLSDKPIGERRLRTRINDNNLHAEHSRAATNLPRWALVLAVSAA